MAPPEPGHTLWTKAVNSAGGCSMWQMRMLMPFAMAIDILERAHIDVFADKSAVECCVKHLRKPNHKVYFLQHPRPQVTEVKNINESRVLAIFSSWR